MSSKSKALYELGPHRKEYERNKKIILATQNICGICGQPVDKTLKYPHPMSATCDHIIPVSRGGDPTSLDNLQLAHFSCNRQKWDSILTPKAEDDQNSGYLSNRLLPQSIPWASYNGSYTAEH